MLTAANVDFAIQELVERGGFTAPPPSPRDSVLSYLPLCHVAERIFSGWFGAGAGVCVHFAESIETVATNLHEVQPTILFGVPRIWEKIAAGVQIRIASADPVKRRIGGYWLRRADWIGDVLAANGGRHTAGLPAVYAVGWLFCYRALKDRVGLRKVRYAASGAAPIAPEVLRFFMGLGLPMHEVYGMTENTAVATAQPPGPGQSRHRRRSARGRRGADRREHRRDPHPASRARSPATGRTRTRPRRCSTRTAGCTPATWGSGSTARTCGSPTG